MKKKTGFFIISLVCVILCSTSCTFLGLGAYPQDTDSTDTGYIQLFLGSPSRSVVTASKDTTSRYRVSIEGTSIVHEFGPTAAGQQRIELNPGTYSVTLTALNAQSRETASNTKTVRVDPGKTTPVSFELKAANVENRTFICGIWEKRLSPAL